MFAIFHPIFDLSHTFISIQAVLSKSSYNGIYAWARMSISLGIKLMVKLACLSIYNMGDLPLFKL